MAVLNEEIECLKKLSELNIEKHIPIELGGLITQNEKKQLS